MGQNKVHSIWDLSLQKVQALLTKEGWEGFCGHMEIVEN
jgi:hypothetical protein